MINHVRTLLMNRGREGHPLTESGEEYIPYEYVPHVLNRTLLLVQQVLFGNNPDRLFLNYRMRQIMQMMHATPLADDLLVDDKRITYLPFKKDLFDDVFRLTVTQVAGPEVVVHIRGEHVANMSSGLTRQLWDVEVLGAGVVKVIKRLGKPQEVVVTITRDEPVPLIGSDIKIYLHDAPVGYQARIEAVARPELDISQALSNISMGLGENGLTDIFPTIASEPLVTWKRIWNDHTDAAVRFTALLLAIAYRISQLPQEGRRV